MLVMGTNPCRPGFGAYVWFGAYQQHTNRRATCHVNQSTRILAARSANCRPRKLSFEDEVTTPPALLLVAESRLACISHKLLAMLAREWRDLGQHLSYLLLSFGLAMMVMVCPRPRNHNSPLLLKLSSRLVGCSQQLVVVPAFLSLQLHLSLVGLILVHKPKPHSPP